MRIALALLALVSLHCSACSTDSITVTYNGGKAKVTASSKEVRITQKGSHITVVDTLKDNPLSIRLKGKSKNGTFEIKTKNELTIRLDNLDLTSNEGAPLVVKNKKKTPLAIIAEKGTTNSLTVTACEDTATHKAAALWAKQNLAFGGEGTLNVLATGKGCKGISTKGDLSMSDLTLNVTTTGMYLCEDTTQNFGFPGGPGMGGAPPFGVGGFNPDDIPEEAKKQFEEMRKMFEGEGNPFGAGGNPFGAGGNPFGGGGNPFGGGMPPMGGPGGGGMPPMMGEYIGTTKGVKAKGAITINSGKLTINTSTPGSEGLEGKKGITFNGGDVYIKAYDDAINANSTITFNGGNITAWSTSNDAIDANIEGGFPMFGGPFGGMNNNGGEGKKEEKKKDEKPGFVINGGNIFAFSQVGPPEEGFDCDFASFVVNGGTAFSIGAGMGDMPSVPTEETANQPTVLIIGIDFKEGETVKVTDGTGKEIISFKAPFSFTRSSTMITSPLFEVGKTYTVKSGEKSHEVKVTSAFTTVGQSQNRMGGFPFGR